MEQQGRVNNHTFKLLNFRSIILAPTIIIYIHELERCFFKRVWTHDHICNSLKQALYCNALYGFVVGEPCCCKGVVAFMVGFPKLWESWGSCIMSQEEMSQPVHIVTSSHPWILDKLQATVRGFSSTWQIPADPILAQGYAEKSPSPDTKSTHVCHPNLPSGKLT